MAKDRQSINKAATELCDLLDEGGTITLIHRQAADRLRKLAEAGGTYRRKYETNEERVLHRHLNLYRNRLRDAKTESEKLRWQSKIVEQKSKIEAFNGLDLDGL